MWSRGSISRPLRPYETNPMRTSDPGHVYKIRTSPEIVGHPDALSRQPYSPIQSPVVKSIDRKKSFWYALRRKSDSIVDARGSQQDLPTSTPVSRWGRKGFENRFHTSIDLSARDGKSCPPIVRAAQAGSVDEIEALLDAGANLEDRHRPTGRNAMAVAAHCGHEDVVELLLRHGANISGRDYLFCTPVHLAASRGHVGVLQRLIRENASFEDKGPDEKTPLRLSCDNGYLEAAELLLAHGAKVNARDKSNLTSLHAAAKRGDCDTVALLVRYGAQIQAKDAKFMDALHYACDGGHNAVVEQLLSKKVDIETPGNEHKTPLITAASAGHAHTVDFLLKRKASLKSKGSGDMTALHWAAFNGHVEVVDLLAQKKAQINAINVDGRTPLHLAVMGEHFPVVELLLRKNSTLEAQCKNNFRPLHYACGFDNSDIALLLLRSGADVEASASTQIRPLHVAVTSGKLSNVTILLDHGANINTRNANGDRPLLLACSAGHAEITKILLDRGAPLRAKFAFGPSHEDSPLCVAAKNGHTDVVDLLISRGSSVREKDEHAWQPLRYGAHYGHPEVIERLLAAGASLSGSQTWGFNPTATTIGFAQNVNISEDRKEHVMILLRNAEEREREVEESEYVQQHQRRPSIPNPNIPELDPGSYPMQTELRSSTTRAGAHGLTRKFSFESQAHSSNSEGTLQPRNQPYSGVSPMAAGDYGLTDFASPTESQTISPMPSQPYSVNNAREQMHSMVSTMSGNAPPSLTPVRTASERIPNRLKDVSRRWQETIAEVPNRSATVSSSVFQARRQEAAPVISPLPSRPVVSPTPTPFPTMSNTSTPVNRGLGRSNTSVPFSPDSIIRPPPPIQHLQTPGPEIPSNGKDIDLTDPSWMPLLDELMSLGITENQITQDRTFIMNYIQQRQAGQLGGGVGPSAPRMNPFPPPQPWPAGVPAYYNPTPPMSMASPSPLPVVREGSSHQEYRSGLFEME